MAIREAGEGLAVLGSGDSCWWRDVVGEPTVLIEVDDQEARRGGKSVGSPKCREEVKTYVFSQYGEFRIESYRCLIMSSPAAMLLVGCMESTVQHSGLMYEN